MRRRIYFSSIFGRGLWKKLKLTLAFFGVLSTCFVLFQNYSKETKLVAEKSSKLVAEKASKLVAEKASKQVAEKASKLVTENAPKPEVNTKTMFCCNNKYFYIISSGRVTYKIPASSRSKIVSAYQKSISNTSVEIVIGDVILNEDIENYLSMLPKDMQNFVYICPDKNYENTFCVLHWLTGSDQTHYRRHICNHMDTKCDVMDLPILQANVSLQNIFSSRRRKVFCNKNSNIKEYCTDSNLKPIDFVFKPAYDSKNGIDYQKNIDNIPIIIVASSRITYLIQCIEVLLSTDGVRRENIVVHTDSSNQQVRDVAQLFNLRYERVRKVCDRTCQISQHYLYMLEDMFKAFPKANELIIIEEDLLVAPDIMVFFSSTIEYLRKNSSYYCISAWNDQSYIHSLGDPSLLYLSQTMPGLGWILTRDIFFNDLFPVWPDKTSNLDWDMWMRRPEIQKGRECIIPDISRTFHFGVTGNSLYEELFNKHFKTRFKSQFKYITFDVSWLENNSYDKLMRELISKGTQITKNELCSIGNNGYIESMKGIVNPTINNHADLIAKTRTICIDGSKRNVDRTWLSLTKCWRIWDIDVRGVHNGVIRVWFGGLHYMVIMKGKTNYDTNGLICL